MKRRKQPETTVYLGDEVYRRLERYREQIPHPPSISSVVREAVERYLNEMDAEEGRLPPANWVTATEAHMNWLCDQGIAIDSEQLIKVTHTAEDERVHALLGDEEG